MGYLSGHVGDISKHPDARMLSQITELPFGVILVEGSVLNCMTNQWRSWHVVAFHLIILGLVDLFFEGNSCRLWDLPPCLFFSYKI